VSQFTKFTGRLNQYQIGAGSLFIIPSIPAAIYLTLGYQSQPTLALVSIIVLVSSLAAVWARGLIDRAYPIEIIPKIRGAPAQFLTMLAVYALIRAIAAPIISAQIAAISSYGTSADLAILVQTPIMETLVVQYFLFYGFLAAGMYLTKKNFYASLTIGTLLSTPWAYVFHYYVYNTVPSVWNWVFASFIILNVGYGLTGNIVVPMVAHLMIDALGLVISLILPSACPGLLGFC
jgi:hypothetical protein